VRVFSGAASHAEGAGARGAFGECLSGKHGAEGQFGLFTHTPGSARPTGPAAQPTGTPDNTSAVECVNEKALQQQQKAVFHSLAARVSVGLWRALRNNRLVLVIVNQNLVTRESGFLAS